MKRRRALALVLAALLGCSDSAGSEAASWRWSSGCRRRAVSNSDDTVQLRARALDQTATAWPRRSSGCTPDTHRST